MTVSDHHSDTQADLPRRVNRMVYAYVDQRTHARTDIWRRDVPIKVSQKTNRRYRDYSSEYVEVNNRLCESAFLAMRSRRSQRDFVDFFIGTICSTPQSLPEDDYLALAEALNREGDAWEEVKALAMLTISSLYVRTGDDS